MRFAIKLWLPVVVAVVFVWTAPAAFASAAPVQQHSQGASVVIHDGRPAVGITLTPGRHAVSEKVSLPADSGPLSRHAPAHLGPAASGSSPQVQVRVGKNNCAGYNGQIGWSFIGVSVDSWFFQTYGTAWDDCGVYTHPTQVFIYISWTCFSCDPGNLGIDGPYSGGTGNVSEGINTGPLYTFELTGPSNVKVTACLKWNNGWGCGTPQSV